MTHVLRAESKSDRQNRVIGHPSREMNGWAIVLLVMTMRKNSMVERRKLDDHPARDLRSEHHMQRVDALQMTEIVFIVLRDAVYEMKGSGLRTEPLVIP